MHIGSIHWISVIVDGKMLSCQASQLMSTLIPIVVHHCNIAYCLLIARMDGMQFIQVVSSV